MQRVVRTDTKTGESYSLTVTDKAWDRIKQSPKLCGANLMWKLAPPKTIPPTIAPKPTVIPHDDLAEGNQITYTDESYRYDCEKGKELFKSKEPEKALEFLERALEFQPKNTHVRGIIKKIKNGQSTTD